MICPSITAAFASEAFSLVFKLSFRCGENVQRKPPRRRTPMHSGARTALLGTRDDPGRVLSESKRPQRVDASLLGHSVAWRMAWHFSIHAITQFRLI